MSIRRKFKELIPKCIYFNSFYYKICNTVKPISIAIVKLANVPISTYSVVLISCALFNSPKRKIDFAANKNPMPSAFPINMKVNIRIRSKYPIHFPALGRLFSAVAEGVHFLMNRLKNIEVGFNINK